jgi:CubicO group peptidase (beta-lactamase class C family)
MSTPTPRATSDPPDANEALLRAVSLNDAGEAERLLNEDGAKLDYADEDGLTAYRIAVALGSDELAGRLQAKGARTDGRDADKRALVDRVFRHLTEAGCPGAAVSVARGGELLFSSGYGLAQLEYDIPISAATIFHVASVSKQVTAFSVAVLAAEGSVSLDEDIRTYIPEAPDFGERITLRHLAHHTSGLRDQWELLGMAGVRIDDVITTDDILTLFKHQAELNFPPGSEFLYCNTGYTLLAEIVARVTGETFHDWTRDRLFIPLGMTDTHFHDDHRRIVPGRAYSYQRVDDAYINGVLSFANVGATSLFTTVEDFAKWTHNLDTGELGGADTIALMHEVRPLNDDSGKPYAFGLVLREFRGLPVVEHGGGDAGFRSHAMRFPAHRLSVHVFGNLADLGPSVLARRVASVYLEDEMHAAEGSVGRAIPTSDTARAAAPDLPLDDYVGEYALDDGSVVRVSREGDRLVRDADGYPTSRLASEGGHAFSVEGTDIRLTFRRDVAGAVTFLDVRTGEQRLTGARHDPAWRPDQLGEYVGAYYSPELDTTYRLLFEDDALVVAHRRHGRFPLTRSRGDAFRAGQYYFQVAEFTRDDGGSITGFHLTTGRVRRLRFLRRQGH